jgi:2'-5' RNA ligase
MDAQPLKERVFFALIPPPAVRQELLRAQQLWCREMTIHLKGKVIPVANFHLTLSFIGQQTSEQIEALKRQAMQIETAPFSLKIDRWGHFEGPRIGWIGCQAPLELAQLAQQLDADPMCFTPHISLFRGWSLALPKAMPNPIVWHAERFDLMRSHRGEYQSIGHWRL